MNEEFSFEIDEESMNKLRESLDLDEIEARHKRFMNGTETIDDLINGIIHYRIQNDNGLDLNVVEFKYYQKMIGLYEKEKEKNRILESKNIKLCDDNLELIKQNPYDKKLHYKYVERSKIEPQWYEKEE